MTIFEYKSICEEELVMAKARVQVIEDLIGRGVEFKDETENEAEAEAIATEEDTEVEVVAETATDESY